MSDLNIPKPEENSLPQIPNVEVIANAYGFPTNQGQLREVIIDQFGISKVLLSTYLKGMNVLQSKIGEQPTQTNYDGKLPAVKAQDTPVATSGLGTPIWDYLIIQGDTYQDRTYGNVTYTDQRIDTILITLQQSHALVLTEIQGRDNEVIEYVGKKSIRINFKGGIYGNNNNRPKAEIANIMKMLNSNKPLKIKFCGFLSEWNISELYVMDKSIPQSMGGYNYQLFEFNAINSVPVILAAKQTV